MKRIVCLGLVGSTLLALDLNRGRLSDTPVSDPPTTQVVGSVLSLPKLVRLEGAEYTIGSPIETTTSASYRGIEKPQHTVTVADFYIGKYLVTASEFCEYLNEAGDRTDLAPASKGVNWSTIVINAGKYQPQHGADRCPAYPVSWAGAGRYCRWLAAKTGVSLRLPTESEWEYAARGKVLRNWPWGNAKPKSEYRKGKPGNWLPFYDLRGYRWMFVPGDGARPWMKAPVGSFPLGDTPEGVCDMLSYYPGQWCTDMFEVYDDTVKNNIKVSPEARVVRGAFQVEVDYSTHKPLLGGARKLVFGDGGVPQYTEGRSWSRIPGDITKDGAMLRLACDTIIPSK